MAASGAAGPSAASTRGAGGPGHIMLLSDAADGMAEGGGEEGSSESEEDEDEQGQRGRPVAGGREENEMRLTARGGRSLRDRSRLGPKKYGARLIANARTVPLLLDWSTGSQQVCAA
eukprot:1159727-Pelagomonas_calceolata.AAC.12